MMYTKLAIFLYLMFFCLPTFAINALLYYEPSENPSSSCMVLYFKGNEPWHNLCSGDIVGKDKFLTAGHCAVKAGETAVVRCPNQDQREWLVKGQLIHPLYPGIDESSPFDHALLQVESDFLNFEPVRLPQNDEEMYSLLEGECAIFGYGLDSFGNSGTLLGAPISADHNSSLGFEIFGAIGGPSYAEGGDSGGGLFCRDSNLDSKWVRIATLSQISDLNGQRITAAAPLSRPIVNWIERSLETEFPPVASFQEIPPIATVPVEEMETAEECTLRLVQAAVSDSTGQLEQLLEAEILHQCGPTVSPESLNPLLAKYRPQTEQQREQIHLLEIKNSRSFIIEKIGTPNWYCPQEYYEHTYCMECEVYLEDCLLDIDEEDGKERKWKKIHCERDFQWCINRIERGISDMESFFEECSESIKRHTSFKTRKEAYEQPVERLLIGFCMHTQINQIDRWGKRNLIKNLTVHFMENVKPELNYYSSNPAQCEQILKNAALYSDHLADNLPQITSEQCQPVLGFPNSNNKAMDYNECASRLEGEGKSEREVAAECVLSNLDLPALEDFKLWISSFL